MIKLIKAILFFLVVPEFLGLGMLHFIKKDKNNIVLGLVIGYIVEFMVYEALAIPLTYLKFTFKTLSYVWLITIVSFVWISVLIVCHDLKEIIVSNIKEFNKLNKCLLIAFLMIVLFQCHVGFNYMHEDYDDSNFIAKATIAKDTNTLHKYDDIGNEYESLPTRQVFSPFPFYTATLSMIIDVHPAILARTVFPVVFIPIAYMVYALLGDVLFKENKNQVLIFLIILSIIYMFGAYSVYTNFVFLLYRIWQGKSILANIIIPFIWLIFIKYINEEERFIHWCILFFTLWGADLLSSMALFLGAMTAFILALIYSVKDKKISYLIKTIICSVPSVIYGIMYLSLGGLK